MSHSEFSSWTTILFCVNSRASTSQHRLPRLRRPATGSRRENGSASHYDLVILDIEMPELDGFRCLRKSDRVKSKTSPGHHADRPRRHRVIIEHTNWAPIRSRQTRQLAPAQLSNSIRHSHKPGRSSPVPQNFHQDPRLGADGGGRGGRRPRLFAVHCRSRRRTEQQLPSSDRAHNSRNSSWVFACLPGAPFRNTPERPAVRPPTPPFLRLSSTSPISPGNQSKPRRQKVCQCHASATSSFAGTLVGSAMRQAARFVGNEAGGTATMFALTLPVLIAASGVAIDYSYALMTQSKMKGVAHSAAFALPFEKFNSRRPTQAGSL